MSKFSIHLITLLSLAVTSCFAETTSDADGVEPIEGVELEIIATFQHPEISESSGIAISRWWPDVIWTHNDSGDSARIFATDLKGNVLMPNFVNTETYKGLSVGNAVNVDWEDIATDNEGNLYIAACGNNANMRRDLAIYKIREPDPNTAITTRYHQVYPFTWPDQQSFPPKLKNFDCEAIFWANGTIYLLSKNRSDRLTKLYRFETLKHDELNIPTLVDSFEVFGQVTAADATDDGSRIAVLTYDNVWVFELTGVDGMYQDDWFKGKVYYLKTIRENTQQCEGISFLDPETLLITNEQGQIFQLNLDQMMVMPASKTTDLPE